MKYRRLTREELEELRPQFVRFLAAQGIDAELWLKLKATDEARADELVDGFSAMVYDDVLARAEYIEERTHRQLFVYHCGPTLVTLRGLMVAGELEGFSFRENRGRDTDEVLAELGRRGTKVQVVQAKRDYAPNREEDLFAVLQRGGRVLPDATLYELIDGMTDAPEPAA